MEHEKQERWRSLNYAMVLGNSYQETADVLFRDVEGNDLKVTVQVNSVTEKYIVIKGGLIPIHSVLDVTW
jgi:hypothetical protein